jgi:hypothetical protein
MKRFGLVVSLAAVPLLSACANQAGEPPASAAPTPSTPPGSGTPEGEGQGVSLEELLSREAGTLTPRPIKGAGGAWRAQALSAAEPSLQTADDATAVVDIPIGTQTPIHCQIFNEAVEPGSTIAAFLARSAERVRFERIVPAGVRVVKRAPAAFIDSLYTVESEGDKLVGNLKLAIYAHHRRSILCLHDEGGYRASFVRVSTGFFDSFELEEPEKIKPSYLDVSKTSIEDLDIGFGVTRVLPDKNGEKTYFTQNTSFIPVSTHELAIKDDMTIIQVDAKGRLTKGAWGEVEDGNLALEIQVTARDKGGYHYEGTARGKAVRGDIDAKQRLSTPFDIIALMKKQGKSGKAFSLVLNEYHPSLDPTKATPVTYSREAGAAPNEVKAEVGAQSATFTLDDSGVPKSAAFPLGGDKTLRIVREYTEGTP